MFGVLYKKVNSFGVTFSLSPQTENYNTMMLKRQITFK